ncbi:protein kinase subdomain-containing protein [Nannizzia gypsea CBS 118893]|uniref:Protein kinase subdomain-containing protein n=1 Tax=Arthroderma gypseum (strain ATCC MYA-4604 / CBS 118893) TaxID=535722 RepID=E4USE9_ARTGP|nr:protein kinase subdomain-containing protein [Nannizzia gypsea CBS 118893]EFR00516.1 protein kinase subdomain-containing protein [Nannizzia gypsea CBS 118893]
MASEIHSSHATTSNPLDREGLRLLSFDGGGVRGLSSLYILKAIMDRLNAERGDSHKLKPCEVFDMIGGTSTGGIIAIMLGRLEMDVDECIDVYGTLSREVFGQKKHLIPMKINSKIRPRFDSDKLEKIIKKVMSSKGISEDELLNNGEKRGCHVFVCATDCNSKTVTRLRSYKLLDQSNVPATICQAALATSAATTFFKPVTIGGRTFADGAFGANNPASEVEAEASNIWCNDTADLSPLVKCFISIGTGNPGMRPFEKNFLKTIGKSLAQLVTDTENKEAKFIDRWRGHYDTKRYFRFNVEQGLQNVRLHEYAKIGMILSATDNYLNHRARISQVRDCVLSMQLKESAGTNGVYSGCKQNSIPLFSNAILTENTSTMHTRNEHWCVERSSNTLFTGRREIINQIKRAITLGEINQTQRRFVITGMGGVGKSEICLKVAQEMREKFWGVFWVDVCNNETAEAGFNTIAETLGSSTKTIDGTRRLLANAKDDWLLILDNADDVTMDYGRYIPSGLRGALLLTSRNDDCGQLNTVGSLTLGSLGSSDCVELLLRAAGLELSAGYEEPAMRIVSTLGSHTLALLQAGGYIKKFCSIEEYPAMYEKEPKQVLNFALTQAQSRYCNIFATFETSIQDLVSSGKEESLDALNMLHILAMLHHGSVPLELFRDAWRGAQRAQKPLSDPANIAQLTSWHALRLPSFIQWQESTWEPSWWRLRNALNLLKSLALIQEGEELGHPDISLHPIVHKWAYLRQTDKQRNESWISAGCTVALSCYPDPEWRPYYPLLSLHLQSFLDNEEEVYFPQHELSLSNLFDFPPNLTETWKMCQFLFRCCWLMQEQDMHTAANQLVTTLFKRLKLQPKSTWRIPIPLDTLATEIQQSLGKYNESVEHCKGVLDFRTIGHPKRHTSRFNLTTAYRKSGQARKTKQIMEGLVETEKGLGGTSWNSLSSLHELAASYLTDGQADRAISFYKQGSEVRGRTSAKGCPDLLVLQASLSCAYIINNQLKEAIPLLEDVVRLLETWPKDSLDRLYFQYLLARAYLENSQTQEGAELLKNTARELRKTNLSDKMVLDFRLPKTYRRSGQIRKKYNASGNSHSRRLPTPKIGRAMSTTAVASE